VNERASCQYMKLNTPQGLLDCLLTGRTAVEVPADVADRARASLAAMVAIGSPGGGE
jgi:quinolinate synthase